MRQSGGRARLAATCCDWTLLTRGFGRCASKAGVAIDLISTYSQEKAEVLCVEFEIARCDDKSLEESTCKDDGVLQDMGVLPSFRPIRDTAGCLPFQLFDTLCFSGIEVHALVDARHLSLAAIVTIGRNGTLNWCVQST